MTQAHRLERGAPGWPHRLADLGETAPALWVLGRMPAAGAPMAAVVGSRRPSPGGLLTAREIGYELAVAGIVVVSGLARGTDAAAHRGALDAGGVTLAVLGCGIGLCYPPENRSLRDLITEQGAVVSEDGGDEPPERWRFPRRNRLIAALSEAVVVVEASEKSGALSTARQALDLGREVLAVPGSVRSATSRGTNALIRDGAAPYLGITDLLGAVPALARGFAVSPSRQPRGDPTPATSDEPDPVLRGLLDALAGEAVHPDDLATALALTAPQVTVAITTLQLRGAVTEVSGGRVTRTF